jgi:hypothetical protein
VIAYIRSQYSPQNLPDWVGRFEGDVDYEAVLRQAGVELPYSGDHGDHDDGDDSGDKSDVSDNVIAEGVPPTQASTMVANYTLSPPPTGTHGRSRAPTHCHPSSEPMKESQKEPREPMEKPREAMKEPAKRVKVDTLPPIVTTVVTPKKVSISERMKSGEITLEEKPDVIQAKKVLTEKFTDTQAHDPSMVQLPGGGWGEVASVTLHASCINHRDQSQPSSAKQARCRDNVDCIQYTYKRYHPALLKRTPEFKEAKAKHVVSQNRLYARHPRKTKPF